jgi:hypothetical protein
MDVSLLASILSPCLGLLLAGANAAAAEVGKGVGGDVLAVAKRLWAKLRPHVEERSGALEAAEDAAGRPDDPRAVAALELQLEKLLDGQPALVEELAAIVREAQAAGIVAVGARSVAVGGNVAGSTIVTGDSNTLR